VEIAGAMLTDFAGVSKEKAVFLLLRAYVRLVCTLIFALGFMHSRRETSL
jgi:hypothetical protein